MSLLDALNTVLNQGQADKGQVKDEQFEQIAEHAPSDQFGSAIADTLRSDQTPPMGDMVAQLFGKANNTQQAGMLNQVLSALGPAAAAAIAGGVLGKIMQPGQRSVSPAQAAQMSPAQVKEVVTQAQAQNPGVADKLGEFYAQHSGLVKTIGGASLLYLLTKMKDNMSER